MKTKFVTETRKVVFLPCLTKVVSKLIQTINLKDIWGSPDVWYNNDCWYCDITFSTERKKVLIDD